MFDFGTLSNTNAVAVKQLKPWGIYNVTFDGARKDKVKGKKDPNESFDVLKLRFSGDEGFYEETIFYLRDGDEERRSFENAKGQTTYMPSNFERTMALIAQVGTVLNPEGYAKMKEYSKAGKFKTFDDVVNAFIKVTDKAKGTKTNIKLAGKNRNGNIQTVLPQFVNVNSMGQVYVSDNFIGDHLSFTAYEERQRNNMLKAKPTVMPDEINVDLPTTNEEIDFEL